MSCPCEAAEVVNDLPCGSVPLLVKMAEYAKEIPSLRLKSMKHTLSQQCKPRSAIAHPFD
jgi:hypothetical protein